MEMYRIFPPYALTKCSSKIEATEFEQREVRSLIYIYKREPIKKTCIYEEFIDTRFYI